MNFFLKLIITAVAVIVVSYLLPGVSVDGFFTAFIVAIVLSLLNVTVKPLLIILTIPLSILTLGIFLLVINAVMILLADSIMPGFQVNGFWWALLFSLLLSLVNTLLTDLSGSNQK
ncbi:MAG: putative membrane protein [Cyclobacteriaceae bacterium]|jgi:putative membrane protein